MESPFSAIPSAFSQIKIYFTFYLKIYILFKDFIFYWEYFESSQFFLQNWNILIKRLCVGPDDPQFKTSIWDYWSTGIHITIIIKTFETKFPPRYGLSQETWVLQMLKNLETEITGRLLSYSHRHGAAGQNIAILWTDLNRQQKFQPCSVCVLSFHFFFSPLIESFLSLSEVPSPTRPLLTPCMSYNVWRMFGWITANIPSTPQWARINFLSTSEWSDFSNAGNVEMNLLCSASFLSFLLLTVVHIFLVIERSLWKILLSVRSFFQTRISR